MGGRRDTFKQEGSGINAARQETLILRRLHPSLLAGLAFLAGGCSSPAPVLYPDAHYRSVGAEQAERDVAECRQLAENAGATGDPDAAGRAVGSTAVGGALGAATGAAGGAVVGSAGTGAAIGAASGAAGGLIRSIFSRPQPSGAYRNFVDRCLAERGYTTSGWD